MPNELPSAAHNSAESQLRRDDMPLLATVTTNKKDSKIYFLSIFYN
jgi:hypothetical protein